MSFKKIKEAFFKDDTGELNLLTVMITVLILMFTYVFIKAEVFNQAVSEVMVGSIVQLISIAFGGVGVIGGIGRGIDVVNQSRLKSKEKKSLDDDIKKVEPSVVDVDNDTIVKPGDVRLTKDFKRSEFDCHDGTIVPEKYMSNVVALAQALQLVRDILGPVIVISGFRHTSYNRKVGGAKKSQHITASAADIRINGVTQQRLYEVLEDLIDKGLIPAGGLGLYDSWVHYDIRGVNVRWSKV